MTATALDAFELALRPGQTGPLFHPEPVHFPRKLAAELLEEIHAHQRVLKRAQHPLFDFLSRDRQLVAAQVPGTEIDRQVTVLSATVATMTERPFTASKTAVGASTGAGRPKRWLWSH